MGYGPRRVTQPEIRETFAEGWTVVSIEGASFETNMADWSIHAWLARIEPKAQADLATLVRAASEASPSSRGSVAPRHLSIPRSSP
jgi:hypothetical protein